MDEGKVLDRDRLRKILDAAEQGMVIADEDRDHCRALSAFLESHESDESAWYLQTQAHLLFLHAHFAYTDGDAEKALELFADGVEASEESGDIPRQVACLRGLALCHEYAGQQLEAIDLVFRALELAEAYGEPRALARSLSGLLALYESQGAYEQALETALRIRNIALETGDHMLLATAATYTSLFCGYLSRAEEGLGWVEQGMAICEEHDLQQIRQYLHLYEFFLLHEAGRIDEAVQAAEAQLDAIAALPAQNAAATFVDVAEIYVSAGDLDRASEMLQRADKAASSNRLRAHLLRYHKVAADLHQARGEDVEALSALRSFIELENELRGQQARARLVTVERHFAAELAAKTEEIQHLRTVELVEKNQQLSDLIQQKEEILHVVVHDLRNPLAAAQLLGESLLIDLSTHADDDAVERLQSIGEAAAEMRETIDTLLSDPRSETPGTPAPVGAAVQLAVDDALERLAGRDVMINTTIADVDFIVNSALLRRSLDDLLVNAIESSVAGTVLMVEVESTDQGGATISITGDAVHFDDQSPAGRSLYIARRLIERMRGSIDIESPLAEAQRTATIRLRP